MPKALYICYFGVREPLVQTQVIPYMREIIRGGGARRRGGEDGNVLENIEITLLTFEPGLKKKWTTERIAEERSKLKEMGIDWHCLAYHKTPSVPATAYDILNGAWYTAKLLRREQFDLIHCRVHIPMLMAALARKLSKHKPNLLFDIRGFFPEEYTDAGVWPENGWLYRTAKRVESWLLDEADGFVVLAKKARGILFPEIAEGSRADEYDKTTPATAGGTDKYGRPVEVIPCCVDLKRFKTANEWSRREARAELDIGQRKVIAYVGSFGGWYLTDEMLDFFEAAREADPKVFILVLTQRDIESVAKKIADRGFDKNNYFVGTVTPGELPKYLCAADIAMSFIKACYSKLSSSPTKIAEYLACGLPIIANRGVGDIDELIGRNGVGVLLDDFSKDSYLKALREVETLGDISKKCREAAGREFDLEHVGGARYRRIYERLLNNQDDEQESEGSAPIVSTRADEPKIVAENAK